MTKLVITVLIFSSYLCLGQHVPVIKLPELQRLMADDSRDVHIVNFWATWCGPCVKELPLFEKITRERGANVKVTLVSMDLDLDPDPEKVYKFVSKKNLQSHVVLLDEPDPDLWIEKVDERWSGALPATIILNAKTGKRIFVGRSVREGELEKYIDQIQ